MENIAEEVVRLLREKVLTFGAVESATGGLISHLITNVSGCSRVYMGSITSYHNDVKINVVGVNPDSIEKYGAVSKQVAEEMASGGRKVLDVDICVADTGIAGPTGGSQKKPVGTFWIGLSHKGGTHSQERLFTGDREENKKAAAEAALAWVKGHLENWK
jgi:nicotinamide-nucleotide amidase